MEYFVDTERISLDYSDSRITNDQPPYRITVYDKYGHFDCDVYLTEDQINDLKDGINNIRN